MSNNTIKLKTNLIAAIWLVCALIVSIPMLISYSYASDLSVHGFLQGNYSFNTDEKNPDGGDFKWAEERVQLKVSGSSDPYSFLLKTDAFYDHVDNEAKVELREGYADVSFSNWDARIGRQVITWGIGDLIFINDAFPKDYEAFFSGRPMEYFKKGVDGVKIGLYPSAINIEVIIVPFFEPNTLPSSSRFHNAQNIDADKPDVTLENTETAIRAYRTIGDYDVSLYFYNGFNRMPSMNAHGEYFYPRLSVYGASVEGRALGGVWGVEGGYYDSKEDRSGDNPYVPNSTTRALLSYKHQIIEDLNIGVQYYAEYMHDYSAYSRSLPAGFPKQDRLYQLASIRLTQMLMNQNLTLSMFAFYSPSDSDYLLNPEVKYKFTDSVWAAVGGNIFGGKDNRGQFGVFDKNDNAYTQLRYEF